MNLPGPARYPGQGVEGVKLLLICMVVCNLLLVTAGPAAAQMANELNQTGLDHFSKGFYEAAPRGERAKAADEYRLAEQSFQEAIRRQPDWVDPYLHLARIYFVQQKYLQAAELYQKALALAPQRKEIYLRWASALEKSGDYQGAVKVLQTLRPRKPTSTPWLSWTNSSSGCKLAPKLLQPIRKEANSHGLQEICASLRAGHRTFVFQLPDPRRPKRLLLSDRRSSLLVHDHLGQPHRRQ